MAIKLTNLRDFVATVEEGSIRAAARRLRLNQSALTKSIQHLERTLEVELFHRLPRGLELTVYGKAYYSRAKAVTMDLQRGAEDIRHLKGLGGGQVAIGVSATASLLFLPAAVEQFQARFPDTKLRIVGGSLVVMYPELRDGRLDFGIGPRPAQPLDGDFTLQPLFCQPHVVVCRPGHPLARCTRLEDLIDASWLVGGATDLDLAAPVESFQSANLPAPAKTIRCEYPPAFLSLLMTGDHLMMLPKVWVDSMLGRHHLIAVPVRDRLQHTDICVMRRRGLDPTPAASHLLTIFERLIASLLPPSTRP
ncbi:HTH-type transcriptional regulator GbpR [Pigmentiphaga humi]|uniref:HTH-type transcriptional regulator GbpR n=1 Tax=Pigmentiphaga humi TaxID=2478468 RepID=A0A3P4B5Z7_9BURK|nr:LysR substrate-binding domain-containing protein [Pigmentiphaga humi]VCU71697.1 HTH-type transcriptional regulator GbpR [Pigmentiphaga humi]